MRPDQVLLEELFLKVGRMPQTLGSDHQAAVAATSARVGRTARLLTHATTKDAARTADRHTAPATGRSLRRSPARRDLWRYCQPGSKLRRLSTRRRTYRPKCRGPVRAAPRD